MRSIYTVCDYYKGENLRQYLKIETPSKTTLRTLFAQIAVALGQIHECGLVYCQISLDSVFITEQGYVLLHDLSQCRQIGEKVSLQEIPSQSISPQALASPFVQQSWDWWAYGQLIISVKEGKSSMENVPLEQLSTRFKESKQILRQKGDLNDLVAKLVEQSENRLGTRNDYHEVLNHEYFKGMNKKDLNTRGGEKVKIFFSMNLGKAEYESDEEDWSIFNSYLTDFEFCRELEE